MNVNIEQEIRDYIKDLIHLSLATTKNDKPWICEVHFAYDNDLNLYFRSVESRRHSHEIADNPNVAGNIIRTHTLEDKSVLGVYFEGTARKLEGDQQKLAAEALAKRFNEQSQNILTEAESGDGHKLYVVNVQSWYLFGRFGQPHSTKLKLDWKKTRNT